MDNLVFSELGPVSTVEFSTAHNKIEPLGKAGRKTLGVAITSSNNVITLTSYIDIAEVPNLIEFLQTFIAENNEH